MSKHVTLVGELSRLVEKEKLLVISEIEQGLASDSGSDYKVCPVPNFTSVLLRKGRASKLLFWIPIYLLETNCGLRFYTPYGTRKASPMTSRI